MQQWGLEQWLEHAQRLHSQAIELGLQRVQQVREAMGLRLDCAVFTVGGTNGKGSTCAFIEHVLLAAGYRVGVYGSPHLVHFEERCRIGGVAVDAARLPEHMLAVELARSGLQPPVPLTYFEFTTLAILRLLAAAGLDAVVLEVGMGGRLDAVNVIDADCAVVTGVALDHVEFLGGDREAIGFEKAGIFRAGRVAVVADPDPPQSLLRHAEQVGARVWQVGRDFGWSGADRQQWDYRGVSRRLHGLAYPTMRGVRQLRNASAALAAIEALRERLPVSAQDVRSGLAQAELPGRFQVLPGQPVVVLDVAHNPEAVAVLAESLDAMGYAPRTHAVFGAMADKDLPGMIAAIAPLVQAWHLCELPTPRAASAQALRALLPPSAQAGCHASPHAALADALSQAQPTDRIVVFGSFFTVGDVLAHRASGARGESSPEAASRAV
ncbi:MAG: bifunctional tetrahydrofolate synthase/dihydrofolate synthase [Betaproteobacteria bacterium]|nr:bifunctional tetrahydrofolate synthase/dihydrofolate synthase [Betaproteobacteria bacterium]